MKRLSLQWRITLMTVLLIGVTCVAMKLLLCSSGVHYMDSIGELTGLYRRRRDRLLRPGDGGV